MQETEHFLHHWREMLHLREDAAFVVVYQKFLDQLACMPEGYFDSMPGDFRTEWNAFFFTAHQQYLTLMEREAGRRIEASVGREGITANALLRQIFDGEATIRMGELEKATRTVRCRKMVMVGCGPFPATLLWLAETFPEAECVGLEVNPDSLSMARNLAHRLGRDQLRFSSVDGAAYDYAGTDFIYVANQVVRKRQVLERIEATAQQPVSLIVRDPHRHGWLLAEQVARRLPSAYTLRRTGAESRSYLSHDLVLRLDYS